MKDNVILTGFMGSGKTSVGMRLSYAMKRTVLDTDKWIEKKQQMSISEIFEKKGESAFRQMETECLQELIRTVDRQIISVGGGLPMRQENHELLHQLGTVYYLQITAKAAYERLKNDTGRPLLQVEDPKTRIRELLAERAPVYKSCAHHVIDVTDKDFDTIIQEILTLWNSAGDKVPFKH